MTSLAGDLEGWRLTAKRSVNCPSPKTSPSASRIRFAGEPFGNASLRLGQAKEDLKPCR